MRLFACDNCAQTIYFENRQCGACGYRLGVLPTELNMRAVYEDDDGKLRLVAKPDREIRFCANAGLDVCNWLIEEADGEEYCLACRHNELVPNIDTERGVEHWRRIGQAQRHLFYSVLRLKLPHPDRRQDPDGGLVFDFLEDNGKPAMTGHDEGRIAIRVAEADDAIREQARVSMREQYRTLLGHFRHEMGHFIWNKLVRDAGKAEDCRLVFGDERQPYDVALQSYYANGAAPNWADSFISAYASAHPWEDFAECFAHYLHIVDTLETARAFGVQVEARGHHDLSAEIDFQPYRARSAEELVNAWVPLSMAINALQRSMGEPDSYPFVLSIPVVDKLEYINTLVHSWAASEQKKAA